MLVFGVLALGQVGQIIAADPKPPESMTYQGYLVDVNGDPLGNSAPANYDVVFRIYNAKSGGEPIWTEQQTITVDKGYFSVLLGEGSSFGNEPYSEQISTVFVGEDISDRFIGITVSGISGGVDLEIAPRLRLVTSPYSFTATQARNVIDGSGNRNIFKEVDSNNNASLKLGAGSDPTLTLHEVGGATLAGNLAIDLPTAGVGMEINEQGLSTKFGGLNGDRFSISTARGGFHFDKSIFIDGDIYSFNRDARLYPSNNTDNFLNVNHEGDTIDAYTDKFLIRDEGVSYLEIDPTSSSLNLSTDASKFYMNKQLQINGEVYPSWIGRSAHHTGGLMGSFNNIGNNATKSNPIYVIGSSYAPLEDSLNAMYGIGYTHASASFITGNAAGWGFYIASEGQANAFISGASYGKSYIKSQRGGLSIGTDTPDTNAALTVKGASSTLGFLSWPKSVYITDDTDRGGTISGPGRMAIGIHESRGIYFMDEQEDHYVRIFYENGTVGTGSDIRLKKDIEPVGDVLDKLNEIRGVRYRYKADKETTRFNIGVIAQEVEKVFPELVNKMPRVLESDEEYMTVTYENVTPILIEAVKELRVEKDEQLAQKDERINELEQRLAKLEELVNKIGQGE